MPTETICDTVEDMLDEHPKWVVKIIGKLFGNPPVELAWHVQVYDYDNGRAYESKVSADAVRDAAWDVIAECIDGSREQIEADEQKAITTPTGDNQRQNT